MAWLCQLPSIMCYYIQTHRILRLAVCLLCLIFYCEYIHYYVILLQCRWPHMGSFGFDGTRFALKEKPLKAMILGDTHLLGSKEGHWFDKLRREWQMQRTFQTSMMLHSPDIVFVLGDLLDEGKWCSDSEFKYHVNRFKTMFSSPYKTDLEVLVGNHDIGFHYMMTHQKQIRFEKAFNSSSVKMVRKGENIFILLNSMTFEGDNCRLCSQAMTQLNDIKHQLDCAKAQGRNKNQNCKKYENFKYVRPIILQHFPMYRLSDKDCNTEDSAPADEKSIYFRPRYDCLSKESSDLLFKKLNPRLIVSAHTHHGCYKVHDNNIPEWTVASYSWRNKINPTFLLVSISPSNFSVNQCFMPQENTLIAIYIFGCIFILLTFFLSKKVTKCNDVKLH